ncbi:MAG: hypothetical protein KDD53_05290 [Bdellovibrionales bacterium]|nr:hypothetical protein [Bdellovibrionales bacterium]
MKTTKHIFGLVAISALILCPANAIAENQARYYRTFRASSFNLKNSQTPFSRFLPGVSRVVSARPTQRLGVAPRTPVAILNQSSPPRTPLRVPNHYRTPSGILNASRY